MRKPFAKIFTFRDSELLILKVDSDEKFGIRFMTEIHNNSVEAFIPCSKKLSSEDLQKKFDELTEEKALGFAEKTF